MMRSQSEYNTMPGLIATIEYNTMPGFIATIEYNTMPGLIATIEYNTMHGLIATIEYNTMPGLTTIHCGTCLLTSAINFQSRVLPLFLVLLVCAW